MAWANALLQGILLGGLYALFATGQALVFGIMRLTNLAHGDFTILPAYISLVMVTAFGFNPFYSIPITMVIMFVVGYALQRGVLNRIVGSKIAIGVIVTFGISMVIQNGLLVVFSPDSQGLDAGPIENMSVSIGESLAIGWLPLIIFIMAVVVIAALQLFLDRTKMGRAFRAISDDQEAARLMGINNRHIYAIAMAVALAHHRHRRRHDGHPDHLRPAPGQPAPDLRLRGRDHRRHGIGLGDADRRDRPGSFPDPRRPELLGASWSIFAGHAVFVLILVLRPQGFLAKTVLTKPGASA